jgi:hypothetical protein
VEVSREHSIEYSCSIEFCVKFFSSSATGSISSKTGLQGISHVVGVLCKLSSPPHTHKSKTINNIHTLVFNKECNGTFLT